MKVRRMGDEMFGFAAACNRSFTSADGYPSRNQLAWVAVAGACDAGP